ncbi:MAG: hypothetical protein KA954_07790 [Chitinophagales bacterium]|nr:hypothetical protein [Chitinophagales bacterium]MBP8754136.1 hypothetical protein [Chitinophagales bacterium]MBP9188891.1 hypothetical protein [Chitinophagales bacterium]MBP9548519.1 hypothetical protein [Chitinophagales bacterium]MBP9704843.1 hypothetical protein [Chitinophagales bacterium]
MSVEAYVFGFNNFNNALFSGKHSNLFVIIGVSLILILALILFIQQYLHLRSQNIQINSGVTGNYVIEIDSDDEKEIIIESAHSIHQEKITEQEVLTADAIEHMQTESLLSEIDLQNLKEDIDLQLTKAEQQLHLFALEIYAHGKQEEYHGLQAAIIHLNRIPILYNDLKQFRGNYTGYDRRLIEVLQMFSNALFNYQTLATQNTLLQKEMEEKIFQLYNSQIKELVLVYRGMINRLFQKQAIDLFEPVISILKNIREVMTTIEADNTIV